MERSTIANETRHCLECGKIIFGRKDKKYCDEFCKTAFNNRIRSEGINQATDPAKQQAALEVAAIRRIQDIILENRNKLKNAFEKNGYQVTIDEFNRYGINLKYFTSLYYHLDLYKQFQMCFDYGYSVEDNYVWLIGSTGEISAG